MQQSLEFTAASKPIRPRNGCLRRGSGLKRSNGDMREAIATTTTNGPPSSLVHRIAALSDALAQQEPPEQVSNLLMKFLQGQPAPAFRA
jgi:hypothetical protein